MADNPAQPNRWAIFVCRDCRAEVWAPPNSDLAQARRCLTCQIIAEAPERARAAIRARLGGEETP